jgi:hypothetical protein
MAYRADSDSGYNIPAIHLWPGRRASEIWSLGLRNPWRWSFDNPARGTKGPGDRDVGQNFEEIDYPNQPAAARPGPAWRNREGPAQQRHVLPPFSLPLTDRSSSRPIVRRSITGGFVYRGSAGRDLCKACRAFGDFVSSHMVIQLRSAARPVTPAREPHRGVRRGGAESGEFNAGRAREDMS